MKKDQNYYHKYIIQKIEQHMRCCQRSMPAKVYLNCRCKPSDFETTVLIYKKRRLSKIIFGRNLLHQTFIYPFVKRYHRCRITSKQLISKCINLKYSEFHAVISISKNNVIITVEHFLNNQANLCVLFHH